MAYRVYLSPSDQKKNTYAYGKTTEDVQCGKIAEACRKALIRNGVEVMVGHYKTMAAKCSESNKFKADLHVPIHSNACDGKVSGTRLFCNKFNTNGHKACKAVFERLAPLTPGTSENIKAAPQLYEVKNPTAPTVYVETDFHDVPAVAKWIIANTEKIGEAIAHGICDYFGIKFVEASTSKPVTSKTLYRVQVGAFSVKKNAENMRDKLKKAGFEGFIVESKEN